MLQPCASRWPAVSSAEFAKICEPGFIHWRSSEVTASFGLLGLHCLPRLSSFISQMPTLGLVSCDSLLRAPPPHPTSPWSEITLAAHRASFHGCQSFSLLCHWRFCCCRIVLLGNKALHWFLSRLGRKMQMTWNDLRPLHLVCIPPSFKKRTTVLVWVGTGNLPSFPGSFCWPLLTWQWGIQEGEWLVLSCVFRPAVLNLPKLDLTWLSVFLLNWLAK